ncbi:MAG TPA: zf-HC2 domain-containing protein [Actinomycetota bacterium]|nr:zf-HC2 domain-containing protein [Actinomycetota bacterium]
MTCEGVRDRLPDLLLGHLGEVDEAGVRRHLRACGPCRRDLAALEEGLAVFSRAAHTVEPPAELRERVLAAVEEEWTATGRRSSSGRARRAVLAALGAAALVAGIAGATWGVLAERRADRLDAAAAVLRADAGRYREFLDALGGRAVRVARLASPSDPEIHGSAVVYIGDEGPSWILLYVGGADPGQGAHVELVGDRRTIQAGRLQLDEDGSGSVYWVTRRDLSWQHTVRVVDADGRVLALGKIA